MDMIGQSLQTRLSEWCRRVPVPLIYLFGSVPGACLVPANLVGPLEFDPVKTIELESRLFSLQFLLASLCIAPILRLGQVNLLRFRHAGAVERTVAEEITNPKGGYSE